MAKSMDVYIKDGTENVQDQLKNAVDSVKDIGSEFQETKDTLSDMPGGLDADIMSAFETAQDQGKAEAARDIENIRSTTMEDARKRADSIKSDVTEKIADNDTARSKAEGIQSKYGADAIRRAVDTINQNSDKGRQLMEMLDSALEQSDSAVKDVQSGL